MDRVKAVVDKAKAYHVPIRVGVNSGSLEKDLISKYGGHVTAEGIVESALDKVHLLKIWVMTRWSSVLSLQML